MPKLSHHGRARVTGIKKEHKRTLTHNTGPLCPCKDLRHVHVLMSHSFNKWSLECEEKKLYYWITVTLKIMEQHSISLNSGQEKNRFRLPGATKFCSWASENGQVTLASVVLLVIISNQKPQDCKVSKQ